MVTRLVSGLVVLCVGASPARGEPCTEQLGLVAGDVSPCDGVIVPPDIPDACSSTTASLMSCRRRIAGERAECDIRVQTVEAKLAAVEAARQAERAAGQAVVMPRGTDWSALGWGLVIGAVAGGLVVGGVVAAGR